VQFYPPEISERFSSPKNVGISERANAVGMSGSFICGSFVRLSLRIENEAKEIQAAAFQTNGCGFMIAAAEVLTESLKGRKLTELHGLEPDELQRRIFEELTEFPADRRQCSDLVLEGLKDALTNYRVRRIEEFQGEKALICTCFAVSEEMVANCIKENSFATVGEVTDHCRAGGGCGSCQMMIQELIDSHRTLDE